MAVSLIVKRSEQWQCQPASPAACSLIPRRCVLKATLNFGANLNYGNQTAVELVGDGVEVVASPFPRRVPRCMYIDVGNVLQSSKVANDAVSVGLKNDITMLQVVCSCVNVFASLFRSFSC